VVRGRSGFDRPNPGEGVVGGEGKEASELHQVKAHLLMLGIGVGVSCSGGATQAGGSAAEVQRRRGFLVSFGRGEVARELREDEAELVVGLIEGGEGRRRGFDGEGEPAGVRAERRRCSGAWKRGKGERALGLACWGTCSAHARTRMRAGALIWACHDDGEVAAGGSVWARGRARRGTVRRQRAVEEVGRDAWSGSASRRWPPGRSTATGGAAQRRRSEEAEEQAGGRRIWTNLQFQKFQGPYCKAAITFNLGLK